MKGAVTPDHEMKSDDDTTPVLSSYTVWDRSVTLPFLHLHRSLVRLPLVSLTRLVSSSPRSGSGTEGEKDERLTDGDRSGEVRGEKGKGVTRRDPMHSALMSFATVSRPFHSLLHRYACYRPAPPTGPLRGE